MRASYRTVPLTRYSRRVQAGLSAALRVAEASECKQRHGAVVVRGGRVLSSATNMDKNHPDVLPSELIKSRASVHAEVRAVAQLSDPRGSVVYVARLRRDGTPGYSKPCARCAEYLRKCGVKRIYYT